MKRKIADMIVDILLIATVFSITDAVLQNVFHSENLWLELGVYILFYAIAFGIKKGILILWDRFASKKKEGNNDEKDQ